MTARVALVTGASRGIGAAVARRLAADGLAVALNSLPHLDLVAAAQDVAAGIRDAGGRAAVYPADISDAAAVDGMVGRCAEELGPVQVLVLNAAASVRHHWTEISESDWDTIAAVNLRGAFLCCRRVFGDRQPEGGAVVTVSSVQAKLGVADALPYVTTKAGLLGFTRSLARELGPAGVRVNCVMPGAIQTEAELESFPDQDAVAREVFAVQALRRRGKAEDVAGAVSFLVGPDSGFVTGQTLCVDGGWVLL
jgi:3-oxoacyl-[acyl-carrier protein] reductase